MFKTYLPAGYNGQKLLAHSPMLQVRTFYSSNPVNNQMQDEFITSISFFMKYFKFNLINIFTNHTTGFFKHNHQVITQKAERAVENHLQKLPLDL